MLRIHTGLRKLSKTNVYDLYLLKTNPINIIKPCINISNNDLLFKQDTMGLKRDKYYIEVRDDDAIKRN